MKITKLTNRNIMFSTPEDADSDVHMGVILGTKHNFIVDTGIGGGCAEEMLKYIGGDSKPVIVINTHHDWDHIAGNWVFEGSAIIAHKLCRELMDKTWDEKIQRAVRNNRYFKGEVRKCLPNLLFEGSMHFPEDGICIFHTPGHTQDGISVYDSVDKVLYVGDSFGVDDGEACYWGEEEDITGFRHMIETYKQYDFEICVSGHSEPQTKEVIVLLETALAEACGTNDN
ncbi:MAG: MBL fold metallo-hydrolase [Defluviitaleaceae bacterium]|nr:MBL fold metallo-hydrolase [Defluviitaleaceae bacterium]MCL2836940.1 MBL fold metallo-hydrolase [Defluviitaleaceae bacterium]